MSAETVAARYLFNTGSIRPGWLSMLVSLITLKVTLTKKVLKLYCVEFYHVLKVTRAQYVVTFSFLDASVQNHNWVYWTRLVVRGFK